MTFVHWSFHDCYKGRGLISMEFMGASSFEGNLSVREEIK